MDLRDAFNELDKINETLKEDYFNDTEYIPSDDEVFHTVEELVDYLTPDPKHSAFNADCFYPCDIRSAKVLEQDENHAKMLINLELDPRKIETDTYSGYNFDYMFVDNVDKLVDESFDECNDFLEMYVNKPGFLTADVSIDVDDNLTTDSDGALDGDLDITAIVNIKKKEDKLTEESAKKMAKRLEVSHHNNPIKNPNFSKYGNKQNHDLMIEFDSEYRKADDEIAKVAKVVMDNKHSYKIENFNYLGVYRGYSIISYTITPGKHGSYRYFAIDKAGKIKATSDQESCFENAVDKLPRI